MLRDKGISSCHRGVSARSPHVVVLTAGQRSQLEAITRRSSAPMRQVLRARIVLAAPAGQSNAGIARALAITADTARKWRKRFCGNGIDGLIDLPRSGRPRTFTAEQVAEVKAARALDLYARIWDDEPLGADDYVLSADEKPGVQARHRLRRSLGPAARRPMRVESEYQRGGTLAYFAAYDVHRAHVIGRCGPTTGIEPFGRLAAQVMTSEPYLSARRVFWIVDNGASHRNWAAAKRLDDAYPNAHMVQLPAHASWLNQVEVYFSVVQPRPDRRRRPAARLPGPLQRHRPAVHSTGPSPATTSTTYCTSSAATTWPRPSRLPRDPRRTNGRTHKLPSTSIGWAAAATAVRSTGSLRSENNPLRDLTAVLDVLTSPLRSHRPLESPQSRRRRAAVARNPHRATSRWCRPHARCD